MTGSGESHGARQLLLNRVSAERTTAMKQPRLCLAALIAALSGSLLFSGCYTEFMLADRDPADEPDSEPVYVEQPVICPVYYPPPQEIFFASPVYLPVAGISGSGSAAASPATSPKRDSGPARTSPGPSRPVAPPSRGTGATARAPAPASQAPAPSRASESRPAGGSSGRR